MSLAPQLSLVVLAASAAAQELPRHAALHPAHADVFLAVPDLDGLGAAYRTVPAARVTQDPRFRDALGELGVDPAKLDMSGADFAVLMLETLQLDESLAADLAEAIDAAASLSVSVAGFRTDRDAVAAEVLDADRALLGLERVEAALAARAIEGLAPPSSLAELRLPQADLVDPWGRPWVYRPNGWPRVSTLGADGAAGGRFASHDLSTSTSARELRTSIHFSRYEVQVSVEFDSPEAARAAAASARSIEAIEFGDRLGPAAATGEERLEAGVFSFRGAEAYHQGWFLVDGATVSFGIGADGIAGARGAAGRALGQGRSLADDEAFRDGLARLGASPGQDALVCYTKLPWTHMGVALLEAFAYDDGGEEALAAIRPLARYIGGERAEPTTRRVSIADGRFVWQSFARESSGPQGLGAILGSTPVDPVGLADVAADDMFVYTTSLDAGAMQGALLGWIEEATGESSSSWLAEVEAEYGVRLDRDLFGQLGESVTVHSQPLAGIGMPRAFATIDLADPEVFWDALDVATDDLLADLYVDSGADEPLRVVKRDYRDVDYIVVDPGLSTLLRPTFAILEGDLVVSLSSTHLKREIKRRLTDDVEGGAHPIVARAAAFDGELASVYFMDWGVAVEGVYSIVRAFSGMASTLGDLPIDLTALPPVESITDHLVPTFGYSRHRPGGREAWSESSFGPEVQVGFVFGLGFGVFGMTTTVSEPGEIYVELAPADPQGRSVGEDVAEIEVQGQDAADATRRSFIVLRNALALYKLDNGTYPTQLSDLTQPTSSSPSGYLVSSRVPADGWGRSLRYAKTDGGYRLWSVGPDGLDQDGAGDDLVSR